MSDTKEDVAAKLREDFADDAEVIEELESIWLKINPSAATSTSCEPSTSGNVASTLTHPQPSTTTTTTTDVESTSTSCATPTPAPDQTFEASASNFDLEDDSATLSDVAGAISPLTSLEGNPEGSVGTYVYDIFAEARSFGGIIDSGPETSDAADVIHFTFDFTAPNGVSVHRKFEIKVAPLFIGGIVEKIPVGLVRLLTVLPRPYADVLLQNYCHGFFTKMLHVDLFGDDESGSSVSRSERSEQWDEEFDGRYIEISNLTICQYYRVREGCDLQIATGVLSFDRKEYIFQRTENWFV